MTEDINPYPHNIELECAVLGAVLRSTDALADVRERLTPDDFFYAPHAELFQEFLDGRTTAFTARVNELGASDINALMETVPAQFNLSDGCDTLMDLADRRLVMTTLQAAMTGIEEPQTAMDVAESVIANIQKSVRLSRGGGVTIEESVTTLLKELDSPVDVMTTGISRLDRMGAGFRPGEMTILAGRPSSGKSALALQCAKAVAESGHRVWFASLEMNASSLSMRWLSNVSRVHFGHLRQNELNATEYSRLSDGVTKLTGLPIYIDDRSGLSLGDLRRAMSGQTGLLVVDYLQLLKPPAYARAYRSRTAEVGALSRGLKAIAHDCNVSVLALCQLNRAVEARGGLPHLSDLRDSGEIEQDADLVWMVARDISDENVTDRTVLAIRKFRNGPLGEIDLIFNGEFQLFRERTDGDPVPSGEPDIAEKVRTW
jgi:replicative DNA helicase